MNTSTCDRCGDAHLCPGVRAGTADIRLLDSVRRFTEATFETNPHGVVGSQAAWEAYLHWCTVTGTVPYSNRRFVAAMEALPGVRRVKRSTMRFTGITWKRGQVRGRHAADESERLSPVG